MFFAVMLLLGSACLAKNPVSQASVSSSGSRTIPLTIDAVGNTASLRLQSPFNSVVIQCRPIAGGDWENFKVISVKANPSDLRISLPGDSARKSWRAMGVRSALTSTGKKYPARFFSGRKSFGDAIASSYTQEVPVGVGAPVALASPGNVDNPSVASDARIMSSSVTTVEEPDIWKADGFTVYFFNQLRGLQVIDLSDPSNPLMKARLRLPAKGKDLYIMPAAGSVRFVLLLTQENDNSTWSGNTGVTLVKVDGSSATIVDQAVVSGWLADSRMIGDRLYLATQHWTWDNSGINKDATVLNELVADPVAGKLSMGNSHSIAGSWPVIAAGSDWMAVAVSDWGDWQSSEVTLFSLGREGARQLTMSPVSLFGRIDNKYALQYDGTSLSAVSQRWVNDTDPESANRWWNGTQVTKLQNFASSGDSLASLEIARGETLQATRFAGDKAYVVTARQIDPLFVIDLSSPTNPVIAGQIEVPGWSTQIVPVGHDKLFTIGYGADWKVCASLFNVSDPANPALLNRVSMSSNWGWSAATYDDKALKVLPDNGLVLVPYTSFNSTNCAAERFVQLLDLDPVAGTLSLAGKIDHNFDPLRADVLGTFLASISQRELVTTSIADHSAPVLLADLMLAWPVNRLLSTSAHLLQIENGFASRWWWGSGGAESATARISPVENPDSILREIDLGDGVVKDAALLDTNLYVLRQDQADIPLWCWYSQVATTTPSPTLTLDVYDASGLPDLKLSGSTSVRLPGNDSSWDLSRLLFPSAKSAVVVAQPRARGFRWRGIMPVVDPAPLSKGSSGAVISSCWVYPGYFQPVPSTNPPVALIFGTENPTNPSAQPPLPLADTNATPVVSPAAGGGLLVYGYAAKEAPLSRGTGGLSSCQHYVRILDLNDPFSPVLGPANSLPGRLIGVTDISREGFLAWTETKSPDDSRQIQVSACDAARLSLIGARKLPAGSAAITPSGRDLFSAEANGLFRYSLTDSGALASLGRLSLDWMPSSLCTANTMPALLLGTDGNHLLSWSYADLAGNVFEWRTDRPVNPSDVSVLPDGSVLSPADEYGVDEYHP